MSDSDKTEALEAILASGVNRSRKADGAEVQFDDAAGLERRIGYFDRKAKRGQPRTSYAKFRRD